MKNLAGIALAAIVLMSGYAQAGEVQAAGDGDSDSVLALDWGGEKRLGDDGGRRGPRWGGGYRNRGSCH
jgi:hypothetical protein